MKKPAVFHPILIAVFPILFLYAHNRSEMSANQIFILLGAAIGLALFCWVLFSLWLRDRAKAGLATSIFVFILLTYGHFYNLLDKADIFVPEHRYLLPGVLLAFGYCVYFIHRTRRDFRTATRILNIASAAVIVINIFNIVSYQLSVAQLPSTQTNITKPAVQPPGKSTPDIYLIVLDEYAHPDIIKQHYGYDNSSFVNSLEKKGFFVARGSTTHSSETVKVIASILNMDYTPESESSEVSEQRIMHNEVVSYLRSLGYKYVYFGHWYEADRYRIEADSYFNYYETEGLGALKAEFAHIFWNTTVLSPFYDTIAGESYDGYYRDGLTRTLDQLAKTPAMKGPKFVYAHIISPHEPFVFGPNGEHIAPADFFSDDNHDYLGQYIYITRKIDKIIEDLLKKSSGGPIIIIQSDHGPRWLDGWNMILNAYHLPGNGKEQLYNTISPVNTFRFIFNYYFNAGYEMLGDSMN